MEMDFALKCNILKCRKELKDHAIVTTCSHVFCMECSNHYQLSGQRDGQRRACPACEMDLPNPDDVVVSNLRPTEDYKTSVLSGLSPNIIMECAGRALSFWAYQSTTEIVYQEYLARNLTTKFEALSTQMDKLIHDANGEIANLRTKITNTEADQDGLRRRNEEIYQAYKEKSRKLMQTQELYDKLKRRDMLGHVQEAASNAVEYAVQGSAIGTRYVDKIGAQAHRPVPPAFTNPSTSMNQRPGPADSGETSMGPPPAPTRHMDRGWAGFSSQGSNPQNPLPMPTPSTHRQPLLPRNGPIPTPRLDHNTRPNFPTAQSVQQQRQPLVGININKTSPSGFAGYGMSAGVKVGQPTGAIHGGVARPVVRARVAQRTSSGPPGFRASNAGPPATPNMFSAGGQQYY